MKKNIFIPILVIISFSVNSQTAYITNSHDSTVSVINTATNTVTATIPVGTNPQGVSVSPDGSKVYVANCYYGTVSVINSATNNVTTTITVGTYPYGISVSPDGLRVYVANVDDGTVSVINTGTNTVSATITVGSYPYGVSVSPDGNKVYVTNYGANTVSVINTTTNTVSATITVGSYPYGISVSPDGLRVYVANVDDGTVSVINTGTNTVTATITVGSDPMGVSVTPDGNKVYVTNYGANTVSVINSATNTVSATITVGSAPMGVSVSPDGSKVYVANWGANTVSVINSTTNTVAATITVGTNPVAFGNFISIYSTPTVSILNNVSCYGANNGEAKVKANFGNSPFTYLWNTVPAQTTQTATGLIAGNYMVTVTDSNGVPAIASVNITQPSAINISPDNKTICKGDSTTICVSASGGTPSYHYLWSNSPTSSCQKVFPVNTTSYSATVTDSNGCTATSSFVVTIDTAAIPVITPSGSMLFSTAGSSYQWNLNGSPISGATGQFYSPLGPGNYTVTVKYANYCSATSATTVITGINNLSDNKDINIYPNPVTDNMQIQTTLQIKEIEITDITGRLLYTTTAKTINCSSFSKGVYFIKVTTSEGAVVKKFIKE